jgi:hypothetical protein
MAGNVALNRTGDTACGRCLGYRAEQQGSSRTRGARVRSGLSDADPESDARRISALLPASRVICYLALRELSRLREAFVIGYQLAVVGY